MSDMSEKTKVTGFLATKTKQLNWPSILLVTVFAPLWHRRLILTAWLVVSLVTSSMLFWLNQNVSTFEVSHSQILTWRHGLLFAAAAIIQVVWFRALWRRELIFSLQNSKFSPMLVLLTINVSAAAVLGLLLAFPSTILNLGALARPYGSWWHPIAWSVVLWLSAASIGQWDAMIRQVGPRWLAGPALSILLTLPVTIGFLAQPIDDRSLLALIIPGVAALSHLTDPLLSVLAAVGHWALSLMALWLSTRRNPFWLSH